MPTLETLLARELPDPALRQVALRAVNAVRLGLEKAIGHHAEPGNYPLPDEPGCLERQFLARLGRLRPKALREAVDAVLPRLKADAQTRAGLYGDLAQVNLRSAVPVHRQVLALPVPNALRSAAASVRRQLSARAHRPLVTGAPSRPRGTAAALDPPPALGETPLAGAQASAPGHRLELRVRSVLCQDDTSEANRDDIQLAGVLHDLVGGQSAVLEPFKVGKFKQGEEVRFSPPRVLHSFPLYENADFVQFFETTLVLAEKDFGGLAAHLEDLRTLTEPGLLETAISVVVGVILAAVGVAAAALTAIYAAGAAGVSLLGGPQTTFGEAWNAALGAVVGVAFKVLQALARLDLPTLRDEIFDPFPVAQGVTPRLRLLGSDGTASEERTATFEGFGGVYRVRYDWRVAEGTGRGPAPASVPRGPDPDEVGEAEALANLAKIDHVVFLMLENRSFDHLLGYLKLEGGRGDVDGLTPERSNRREGSRQPYFVHQLEDTAFEQDPPHSHKATRDQIADGAMSGFVDRFAAKWPQADPGAVMGYHGALDVPLYDFFASEYGVCDRWFSSFRGSTWVNRLYALTGQAHGQTDNKEVPLYAHPTFFHHLDAREVSWKAYVHDFSTIRCVDAQYRALGGNHFDPIARFFDHARAGTLPAVSWIEPNYVDVGSLNDLELDEKDYPFFPDRANDDHPPTDIRHAQELVLEIYAALLAGPRWEKTLFVVTYDEHGGFYDHVQPGPAVPDARPPADPDRADAYQRYGLRVPALVVSPWVPRQSVCSQRVFDHTSVIRTILLRFCRDQNGRAPSFTPRTDAAHHLGFLLTQRQPRLPANRAALAARHATVRADLKAARAGAAGTRTAPKRPRTDLERQMLAVFKQLKGAGVLVSS